MTSNDKAHFCEIPMLQSLDRQGENKKKQDNLKHKVDNHSMLSQDIDGFP